ncbi:MAG: hypothetical protein CFE45_42100 [Burkholderiales bacterium PBB5]|nr:MAG: hypothetical protein CFE45_42100 [Burkholderiales bacterium PBB5]
MSAAQRQALKGAPHTAIVVLGAGRRAQVLETGEAALKPLTMERLAHGLWLAKRTGLPVAYSGGIGHGSLPGATEAEVAQRVATQDFGQPLRWTEDRSRDTRENARYSVALLHAAGIQRIVLVTHAFHQRRALAAFERASRDAGVAMALLPAPVGVLPQRPLNLGDWLPNEEAFALSRIVLHEWLGWLAGA